MIPYVLMFTTVSILAFREIFFKLKAGRIPLILVCLLLSVIAGIRVGVGADFYTYSNIYNNVNGYEDLSGWIEPGFRLIIIIIKSFGISPQGFYFIMALLTYSFLIIGLKKLNFYPMYSLLIFFLFFNIGYVYNVMRQGLAMAIFIFILKDILQGKFKKVFLFSLIAASIHSSGIFILFVYYLRKIKLKRSNYIILTVVMSLVLLLSSYMSNIIINILPEALTEIIVDYSYRFAGGIDLVGLAQRLIIISIFIFYYNFIKKSNPEHFETIFLFYYIGFILYCVFGFQHMLATRINMFFRILEISLFPYLIDIKVHKIEKIVILLLVFLIGVSVFSVEVQLPANYPFITIFSN